MFRIKICGITNPADATAAARAGADAVGLNFYPQSPRFIDFEQAQQIIAVVPANVVKVGLFVNAAAEEICDRFDQAGLDMIQLHGDEPPEFLAALGRRPLIRAIRVGREGLGPARDYLAECRRLKCMPRLVLLEALVTGSYGGSGRVADWELLKAYPRDESTPPLVLAGGLTAENVVQAIRTVRPAAVDTASGVESQPGRKDHALLGRFVASAREAFDSIR